MSTTTNSEMNGLPTVNFVSELPITKEYSGGISIVNPLVSSQAGTLFIIARVENADVFKPNFWNYRYTSDNDVPAILIEYTDPNQVPSTGRLYLITIDTIFNTGGQEVVVEVNENFLKKGKKFDEEPVRKTKIIISNPF